MVFWEPEHLHYAFGAQAVLILVGVLVHLIRQRRRKVARGIILENILVSSGRPYTWGEFARDTRDPNVPLDYIAQRCFDAGGVPKRVTSAPDCICAPGVDCSKCDCHEKPETKRVPYWLGTALIVGGVLGGIGPFLPVLKKGR